jgi:putative membrane protein
MTATKPSPPAVFKTPLHVVAAIIGVSMTASIFLVWLVYYHRAADSTMTHLVFLPALNAALNTLCTIALIMGFRNIWQGRVLRHRNWMFTAFFFSSLFLVSYITNHYYHGESKFHGQGLVRYFYYPLLTSHILLSVVALPMILITFFLSLSGRIPMHRRIAQYTYPIWLYVSVTGVIVYAMLAFYR